jgi:sirohydrochlorin cobaltochelatase
MTAHRHGIVLFAHGSRDPAWRAPIEAVADRMRALDAQAQVRCAYLELTEPDLPTAVQTLLAAGVHTITIWPMFLGTGRHAQTDLPRLIDQLRARHAGATFALQPAIAEHPDVLEAMARAALGVLPR